MFFERDADSAVLTGFAQARMGVVAGVDVPPADRIPDQVEGDAVDDDALEAPAEGRVTSGPLGHAPEVVAAADE